MRKYNSNTKLPSKRTLDIYSSNVSVNKLLTDAKNS